MKAMRWLLILLVVLLQVQAPAVAEAAAPVAAASCHDMAGMAHDQGDNGDLGQDQNAKLHQGKAHQCPGCSIPGTTPAVAPLTDAVPCAPMAAPLAALDSHAQPPRLPPPRTA